MDINEAMAILSTVKNDEVYAGQRSMTIPVEVAEAILGLWEQAKTEYGSKQLYQSTVSAYEEFESTQQRDAWAKSGIMCGLTLFSRCIIVLDGWDKYEPLDTEAGE